jgi:hypothetical protein
LLGIGFAKAELAEKGCLDRGPNLVIDSSSVQRFTTNAVASVDSTGRRAAAYCQIGRRPVVPVDTGARRIRPSAS